MFVCRDDLEDARLLSKQQALREQCIRELTVHDTEESAEHHASPPNQSVSLEFDRDDSKWNEVPDIVGEHDGEKDVEAEVGSSMMPECVHEDCDGQDVTWNKSPHSTQESVHHILNIHDDISAVKSQDSIELTREPCVNQTSSFDVHSQREPDSRQEYCADSSLADDSMSGKSDMVSMSSSSQDDTIGVRSPEKQINTDHELFIPCIVNLDDVPLPEGEGPPPCFSVPSFPPLPPHPPISTIDSCRQSREGGVIGNNKAKNKTNKYDTEIGNIPLHEVIMCM